MSKKISQSKKCAKILKQALENEREAMLKSHINPPTRHFKVGDNINYGNWEWSRILEVCDNGYYYKVISITPSIKRGKRIKNNVKVHYLAWHNCWPSSDTSKYTEILQNNEDIRFNYSQMGISSLLNYYYGNYAGIDMDIDYQRGNVWTAEQKYELIDSIYNNIDIGKFVLIKREYEKDQKGYEILDGKQRLSALIEFYEGRFTYKNFYYSEMNLPDRWHFKEYPISMAHTNNLSREQKYRYFLRLNTTGKPIDENHLKKVKKMLVDEKEKVR